MNVSEKVDKYNDQLRFGKFNIHRVSNDVLVNYETISGCAVCYQPGTIRGRPSSKPVVFNLPGVPSPPINLQVTDCYDRRTNLSWTPDISGSSEINHYLIERESNHDPFVFNLVYNVTNPNTTSLTLDLPGWSSLQFRVKAVNNFGPSRPSVATGSGICITPVGCKFY